MAIRERAGRKSPWQVYWNNPITGKRESENFLTKKEAEKHDSLVKHRIKFDRESFTPEQVEEKEPQAELTLEAAYFMYLKQKQFSKKSLGWQLESMREPLKQIGEMSIAHIEKRHIEVVMDSMLKTTLKGSTVRGRLSVLRTVLRWCADKGFREHVDFPRLPSANYEKFVPPTTEELHTIMAHAVPHIIRVVVIGSQFGVRIGPSELLGLQWSDVDLERRILRVHGSKKNTNALWREVPIRESLIPVLSEWKAEDLRTGATHLINYNGKQVASINRSWCATLRRAGITRRIRPYDLRHAFATDLIAAGADIGTVAKLMGHSTPTMILTHYQYVMDSQKRSAIECLPDLGNVPKNMCPKVKAPTELQ